MLLDIAVKTTNSQERIKNFSTILNLDERMNEISNRDVLAERRNPMSLEVIREVSYHVCGLIDSEVEIRLIIFRYFEKNIVSLLNNIYSEIDGVMKVSSSDKKFEPRGQDLSTETILVFKKILLLNRRPDRQYRTF